MWPRAAHSLGRVVHVCQGEKDKASRARPQQRGVCSVGIQEEASGEGLPEDVTSELVLRMRNRKAETEFKVLGVFKEQLG